MSYDDLKKAKTSPGTPPKPPRRAALQKKVIRYDVHGPVSHVLRKIDQHLPHVFSHAPPNFIPSLKHLIKRHAAHNGWEVIALSLSQGLAREEMQNLLAHDIPHKGPIIVDPTAATPEHLTFENMKMARASMERVIMANDADNDILIIIYGLEGIDVEMERQLMLRRLRIMNSTCDMLRENFEWLDDLKDNPDRLEEKLQRALRMVRENLGKLLDYVEGAERRRADFHPDHNAHASAEMFLALVHLREALEGTTDPMLRLTLENVSMQIRHIPDNFVHADYSLVPYERMANELASYKPEAKPVIIVPAPIRRYDDFAPRPM